MALFALVMLAVNWISTDAVLRADAPTSVPYSTFHAQLAAGNVQQATVQGEDVFGTFTRAVSVTPAGGGTPALVSRFSAVVPDVGDSSLMPLLLEKKVTVTAEAPPGTPLWLRLAVGIGPTVLLLGALVWLSRRALSGAAASGLGGIGGFGRSRAALYDPGQGQRTTFADVAGIDDVAAEVSQVVAFLRNPGRYRALGATIPRGVLLAGAPGTGKTLLARAVAGEADVPFFSASASEFVEMVVGVGASRVRDLFARAKKVAPAIVFIDELDAIGGARGVRGIGGHDEQEQTLNQILTEMDGFTGSEGVVVLGATNRPDVLDPALLRPGRFDRQITVSPPDRAGRAKILAVHARGVPLAADVDLAAVAASTPGAVGADLRTLVNEAALRAAGRGDDHVRRADFDAALERTLLGPTRGILLSSEDKLRTAYHEAGHALLGLLAEADPVRKVTIVPRGRALGVTFSSPADDRYGWGEGYLHARLVGAMGGRAAEQVVFGEVTTGAEDDIAQATTTARAMVARWGMSPAVGPVSIGGEDGPADSPRPAPATLELVDAEVRRLLADAYGEARRTLTAHRLQS